MKAIIWTKYGPPDVLQLQEAETPTPESDEVLIKVHAANASRTDTEFRDLKLPFPFALPIRLYLGVARPTRVRILGTEFAGEVASIGNDVTEYHVGDQVYGYTGFKMGAYAEYICLSEKPADDLDGVMSKRPTNVTYEEAASVPFGGMEALHSLDRVKIQRGQKVLIVGAGGSIGTHAVQLAKHYGAEVTAVDSAGKLDMLRSIGADHMIDYAEEDFTKNGKKYDVIIDTIGKSRFGGSVRSLREGGTYLNDNPSILFQIQKGLASGRGNKKILAWKGVYSSENLLRLKELIEAGAVKPVVDRTYPLEQIVEAHKYVETDQKKGNVVITITAEGDALGQIG